MGRGMVAHFKHGSPLLQGLLCAFSWISCCRTTPLVFQGNLESVKELLVVKVPSTLRYLLTGSWVGFVRFGHVAG